VYVTESCDVPEYFQMKAEGYPAFGSSIDVVGPMTFQVIFTRRDWAASHNDLVKRFLAAELKAQRFIMDAKNKDEVLVLLTKSRNYTPEVAALVYDAFMGPYGWARDGAIDMASLATVMKLRAEVENGWGGKPPPPETYVDFSYLNEVIKALEKNKVAGDS
jgi:ABC-type nitrate/sulfonate/bicarbonate transport system substrate-binding protein